MAGLGFASVLTLIGVPVLYHTYLRRERLAERGVQNAPATSIPQDATLSPTQKLAAE